MGSFAPGPFRITPSHVRRKSQDKFSIFQKVFWVWDFRDVFLLPDLFRVTPWPVRRESQDTQKSTRHNTKHRPEEIEKGN